MTTTARDPRRTRLVAMVVAAATVTWGASCNRGKPAAPAEPAPPPSASVAPDQIEPGELAEGSARAFELLLPRGFVVRRTFTDSIASVGPYPLDAVEAYVRRRVEVDRIEAGPMRTVFERVRMREGGPSRHWFRIEINARPEGSELVVRDITPPPDIPGIDETERWRRAGLGPSGKQLDPSEYQ